MISFIHIRNTGNAGDLAACPADYFDFSPLFGSAVEVLNYDTEPAFDSELQVYGGGTMVNWLNGRALASASPKVIWGGGSSRHGMREPWPDPAGFALVGTREWSRERAAAGRYAPCVSCMSPLFDRHYEISRGAVAFVNADPSIRARYPAAYGTGLPTLENTAPFADIVAWLGSASVVVTNSYHGVYWATLLARRVVCLPYSSKFFGFRFAPAYAQDAADWQAAAAGAVRHADALATCRRDSRRFHDRVMDLALERVA